MVRLSKSSLILCLPFILTFLQAVADADGQVLRRRKREWIIAPRKLWENEDYRGLPYIAKIASDKQYELPVSYYLAGSGADQDPVGLFSINPDNGMIRIHGILDREKKAAYHLIGMAKYSNGNRAEKDLDLRIVVLDRNDCPPVFSMQQTGEVYEHSAAGQVIMKVNVTDADEPGTEHTQISFSIVEHSSSDKMFSMNHKTGEILVRQTSLDRETQDTFTLTVKGTDMNGALGGLSGTGQVVIKLLDINDNIPTLEKETYEGSVMENTINVEVLRIKAVDLDLMYSDNWLAVFTIVSGNEAGYFLITTDSKTNEGIISIVKALDYEELKIVNLGVSVSNKAEYNFGSIISGGGGHAGQSKIYSIKINVVNQLEGPRFQPPIKVVTISEDKTTGSLTKIITTYAAIDSDTLLIATNVRYAKLYDIDQWLTIDEKTADIRLNKWPDRESKFVINGTYTAKIVCITNEVPAKTATGTIAIQVKDFNDNCPTLTSTSQTMCQGTNMVYVTAKDEDAFPNGAPFTFRVIEAGNKEKWTVERLNDTTAILRDHASLWVGSYRVALEIKDQQGKVCGEVQWLDVVVCTCDAANTACLGRYEDRRVTVSPLGVLMLLLGLLLLLLLPLFLLFCLCGGTAALGDFKTIPFDTKEHLISYHTEGQAEEKEIPLLRIPAEVDHASIKAVDVTKYGDNQRVDLGGGGGGSGGAGGGFFTSVSTSDRYGYGDFHQVIGRDHVDGMGVGGVTTGGGQFSSWYGAGLYGGIALPDSFLEEYYSSKADHAAQHSQQQDAPRSFEYEGQGSPAGSVGCCSLLEQDSNLDFLDDLSSKFKTLAEVCRGSSLEAEHFVGVSVCPPRPTPSTGAHINTSANLNTHTSSGLATSTSSKLIKETVLREQGSATLPRVHFQETMLVPSQTLLIQQPTMYYTSNPVLYVVEPQPQMHLVEVGGTGLGGQLGAGQGLVQVTRVQGSQQVGQGGVAQVLTSTGQAVIGGGCVVAGGSHTLSGRSQVSPRVGQTGETIGHFSTGSGMSQTSVTTSKYVSMVESSSTVVDSSSTVVDSSSTVVENSPAVIDSSSTVVQNSPAVVDISSTVVENSPAMVDSSSTVVENSPAVVDSSPTVVESSSAVVDSSSTVVENSPAVVDSSSEVVESSSTVVESSSAVVENSSTVVENSSTVVENSSAVVDSSPAVVESSSAVVDNSSAVVENRSAVVDSSSSVVESSSAVVESSSAVVDKSSAVVENSSAVVDSSSSVVESSSAVVESSSAVVDSSSAVVENSSAVVENSSAVVENSSTVVENSPPVVDSSPAVVDSSSPVVYSSSAVVESSSTVVDSSPAVVESSSAVVESSPADADNSSAVVESSPADADNSSAVVESSPDDADNSSAVVDSSSAVVESSPAVVDSSPGVVESSSAVVENSPAVVENSSAVVENSSAVVENSSAVVENSPADADNSLDVVESSPADAENSPAVVENSSAVVESSSADADNSYDVVESSPDDADNSSAVVDSSPLVAEDEAGSASLSLGVALGGSTEEQSLEVRVPSVEIRDGSSLGSGSLAGSVESDQDSV